MKRYLVTGFLMIVPLYGMSMATAELVKSMTPRTDAPLVKPQVIASVKLEPTSSQLTKTVE